MEIEKCILEVAQKLKMDITDVSSILAKYYPESQSPLITASRDVQWKIMLNLDVNDVVSLCQVNQAFKKVCSDDFWRYYLNNKFGLDELAHIFNSWKDYALFIAKEIAAERLTEKDIEEKNYTFVEARYEMDKKEFLVNSTNKEKAMERAKEYIKKRGWGEPQRIYTYPRTYVKKARILFKKGQFYSALTPDEIKSRLDSKKEFTIDDIENKNYTYVVAQYGNLDWPNFLVTTPYKEKALTRAKVYIKKQGWGEPTKIDLYPRNYVKKARILFKEGKYL